MKTRNLIIAAAFALLVVLVIFGWQQQQSFHPDNVHEALLPGLSEEVNTIQMITLHSGNDTLTIEKHDNQWLLREQADYPVDTSKVRSILLKLADSTLVEEKTANSARYDKLGLNEANRVTMHAYLDSDKKDQLFALAIGNTKGTDTYILKENDSQSWLASGDLLVDTQVTSWLQTNLLHIEPSELIKVTITHAGSQTLTLTNPSGEQSMKISDLKNNEEPNQTEINSIETALRDLNISQVRYRSDKTLPTAISSIFTTNTGLVVTVRTYKEADNYWSEFNLHLEKDAIKIDPDNTTDTVENIATASQQQIDRLAPRLQDRVFAIPSSAGKALTAKRSDVITDTAAEKK